MRYLLIFLFTINTGFAICKTDSLENVQSCVLDDRLTELLQEVRPEQRPILHAYYFGDNPCVEEECPPWQPAVDYYTYTDNIKSYVNLVIDPVLPLSELQAVFDAWKSKWVSDWIFWDRVDALGWDVGRHMTKCNYRKSNKEAFLEDIKKDLDETKLSCLESKVAEVNQEDIDRATEEETDNTERTQLRNAIDTFKSGEATNAQVQRAIAYILKRL